MCLCATAAGRPRRGVASGPWQGKEAGPVAPVQGSFSFLCLHAAVALTPLLPSAHSLLLTSGTLSPMEPLVAELGLGAKPGASPASGHKPNAESDAKPNLAPLKSTMSGDIPLWARSHGKAAMAGQACPDSASEQGAPGHTTYSTQVKHESAASARVANDHGLPLASYDPTPASPPIALPAAAAPAAALSIATELKLEPASWPTAEPLSEDGQAHAVSASPSSSPLASLEGGIRQRSQHSRLHQQVELVSAPHNPTLPSRLLPLTLSMAPGRDGQLVKLDSAFDKRQDEGRHVSRCYSKSAPNDRCYP